MNTSRMIALALGLTAIGGVTSTAMAVDPETDRQQIIDFFQAKNPNIPIEAYVNGAYIYDADKFSQWEAAEEFPPYLDGIDAGELAWNQDKTVYQECFGSDITKIRVKYPYFNEDTQQVITLESAINQCRTNAGLKALKWKKGTLAQISAYLAYNARGQVINVKIESEGARKAYEAGRNFFLQPRGQLGLSCAKCHTYNSGRKARSNILSSNIGHTSHFPVFRAKWQNIGTLHRRYAGCNKNMRVKPQKAQSETYRNLEFFQAYISNGLEINGPGYRE